MWVRLCDDWLTRLTEPALYDVSVRNLAALVRVRLATVLCQLTDLHSQASSPRSVALTQLPSPSTLSIRDIIWYTDLLETPRLVQGTGSTQWNGTPLHYAHDGRTNAMDPSRISRRI